MIAHGGGEGLGPSNTIEAMERSVAVGADILDVDLWMTRDGVIVARHDRDLATSTDGIGNIDEQSWVELQQLDAAARWTGEPFDAPVRVPSLEQILTRFADARISLELKQVEPSMADSLCDVLRRTGRPVEYPLLTIPVQAAEWNTKESDREDTRRAQSKEDSRRAGHRPGSRFQSTGYHGSRVPQRMAGLQ